jgi:hypothetical protein
MFQMNTVALRAEPVHHLEEVERQRGGSWPGGLSGAGGAAGRRQRLAVGPRHRAVAPCGPADTDSGRGVVAGRRNRIGAWQNNDPLPTQNALANPSVFGSCRHRRNIARSRALLELDDNGFWFRDHQLRVYAVLRPRPLPDPQQFSRTVDVEQVALRECLCAQQPDDRNVVGAIRARSPES